MGIRFGWVLARRTLARTAHQLGRSGPGDMTWCWTRLGFDLGFGFGFGFAHLVVFPQLGGGPLRTFLSRYSSIGPAHKRRLMRMGPPSSRFQGQRDNTILEAA